MSETYPQQAGKATALDFRDIPMEVGVQLYHCDAHFHLSGLLDAGGKPVFEAGDGLPWRGIVSCHEQRDVQLALELAFKLNQANHRGLNNSRHASLQLSAGVHPEFLDLTDPDWVAGLAERGLICAIGECGFDYFHGREPDSMARQETAFLAMLGLAVAHKLPLVIHNRRAADAVFKHVSVLRKLRAVVFHSCGLAFNEILALLDRGVPAWFSFGTPALWAGPKLQRSIEAVPLQRLLTETDAPCQPVRGQVFTSLQDLVRIEDCLAAFKKCTRAELLEAVNKSWQDCGFDHAAATKP